MRRVRDVYEEREGEDDVTSESEADEEEEDDDVYRDDNELDKEREKKIVRSSNELFLGMSEHDVRPIYLGSSMEDVIGHFDTRPKRLQRDPLVPDTAYETGTPSGTTIQTVEYNFRCAVQRRDEGYACACILEMFRLFVFYTRRARRIVSNSLEQQLRMEAMSSIGPFPTILSLRMHQRIFVLIFSVFVNQIGVADPAGLPLLLTMWKSYERTLFCIPKKSLAQIISMTMLLCHCHKDSSVAYAREVFADTARMRKWRDEAIKHMDILVQVMDHSDMAEKSRKMLQCQQVYYTNRLRKMRYQQVAIASPHPEYIEQGGPMGRRHALRFTDKIRDILPPSCVGALVVLADAEELMMTLCPHINNVFCRDAYDELQLGLLNFLYMMSRVLTDNETEAVSLMKASEVHVSRAPVGVQTVYAGRLWSHYDVANIFEYGITGEAVPKAPKTARKGNITEEVLLEAMDKRPSYVPKVHEKAPPAVERDPDTNVAKSIDCHKVQQHPAVVRSLGFLRRMYILEQNWPKYMSLYQKQARQSNPVNTSTVVMDSELFELGSTRVLHTCPKSHISAVEARLTGRVAKELRRCTPPVNAATDHNQDSRQQHRITVRDGIFASSIIDCLCQPEESRRVQGTRAIIVGPWGIEHIPRLKKHVEAMQEVKAAVRVENDVVVVKRLMMKSWTGVTEDSSDRFKNGRTYAWVVIVPVCIPSAQTVIMTLGDFFAKLKQLDIVGVFRPVCHPNSVIPVMSVMKRFSDPEGPSRPDDNYVSFTLDHDDRTLIVNDYRLHVTTESWPMYNPRPGTPESTTASRLDAVVGRLYKSPQVTADMAECERKISQVMQDKAVMFSELVNIH